MTAKKKAATKNKPKKKQPQEETSTTSSKKKGRSPSAANKAAKQLERDVALMLRHIFPLAQREMEYQGSNNRGNDVEGCEPFLLQCKNYANYVPISKINEIRPKKGEIPVLVTKGINLKPMAVLPLKDLVIVLEAAYGHRPLMVAKKGEEWKPEEIEDTTHGSWVTPLEDVVTEEEHEHIDDLNEHYRKEIERERQEESLGSLNDLF